MTLAARLLRLIESSPLPITTPDLVAITGAQRGAVWAVLVDIEGGGLVVRVRRKHTPRPKRGVCGACKEPDKAILARGLCHACYRRHPELRASAAPSNRGHTVTLWRRVTCASPSVSPAPSDGRGAPG